MATCSAGTSRSPSSVITRATLGASFSNASIRAADTPRLEGQRQREQKRDRGRLQPLANEHGAATAIVMSRFMSGRSRRDAVPRARRDEPRARHDRGPVDQSREPWHLPDPPSPSLPSAAPIPPADATCTRKAAAARPPLTAVIHPRVSGSRRPPRTRRVPPPFRTHAGLRDRRHHGVVGHDRARLGGHDHAAVQDVEGQLLLTADNGSDGGLQSPRIRPRSPCPRIEDRRPCLLCHRRRPRH